MGLTLLVFAALFASVFAQGVDEIEDPCAFVALEDYNFGLHIAAIFIIFVTSVTGAVLPLILRRCKGNLDNIYLSCGKLFGAGVILATGFIHMLTPADQSLTSECLSTAFTEDYRAYAGLFALLAILFVQAMQVSASIYLQNSAHKKRLARGGHSHGHSHDNSQDRELHKETPLSLEEGEGESHSEEEHNPQDEKHEHGETDAGHTHAIIFDARVEKRVGTYVLEIGIASHSVIIGVALGTAADSEFKTLLTALVFHQFFEGLSLATVVLESDFKNKWMPVLMILFYGITTPIGVAIGVGVRDSYNGNAQGTLIATGVLDAVSAGILIYDSLVNIITPHLSCPQFRNTTTLRRLLQLWSMWVGAGIMALIGRWA